MGGATDNPRDGLVDKLDAMAANPGHSWPVVSRILREAASALRTPTEGWARVDLAERLRAEAESKNWWPETRATALLREAASTIDHQTKALEAADELRSAALDLLDSLGEPHYHDLIGMTYTLRKEQADNLRAALEPASPTPTEQENDR